MPGKTARFFSLLTGMLLLVGCAGFNRYPTDGTLALDGLTAPVRVVRDEKGMAYIHAGSLEDAMRALGYVTAQDRLFQMELTRRFASGRISELVGKKARELDIRNRTLGFHRLAVRHSLILSTRERQIYTHYVDGINAFIRTGKDVLPIAFKLSGTAPEPWTIEDCLAIYYLMGWDMSANLKTEVVAQMLIDRLGAGRAAEIFPLVVNPDEAISSASAGSLTPPSSDSLYLATDLRIMGYLADGPLNVGSNNWAIGPALSASGKPVVCDDPHMRTGMLPGPLYPVGIITPDLRVVGVAVPGAVGLAIFRNHRLAVGLTNAYADVQDLYVETVDPQRPDHYLEGDASIPFTTVEETLRIKDRWATGGFRQETVTIRKTRRGPVVSGVLKGLETDKVLSLRWSVAETMAPELGFSLLFSAPSVDVLTAEIAKINVVPLNFVFADVDGHFGWHVSGRLPIRDGGGTVPMAVTDGLDNWQGFVPFAEMPHAENPATGWVATCNHHTVSRDYPYYYSSYQAPGYRYRRLRQLLTDPGVKTVEDHWAMQRDTRNLMAEQLVPDMAPILASDASTREFADILNGWDRHDDRDAIGPTVFHAIYERFAWLTFADELGDSLARQMLGQWYFWQARFKQMILTDHLSGWFDDRTTPDTVEDKGAILVRAAVDARKALTRQLGEDTGRWQWGRVHRHRFVHPVRRKGIGSGVLGGGDHAVDGSGETLYRGRYAFDTPGEVIVSAALRMVADLGDPEKVLAVLAGGVTDRLFHPHNRDQIDAFMDGEKTYWWFSDQAIADHSRSTLILAP